MDAFSIVLVVLALVFLIVYYYKQYKKWKEEQNKLTWPREYTRCPDYWVHNGDHVCKNIFSLGKCPGGAGGVQAQGTVDFKSVVGGVTSDPNVPESLDNAMTTDKSLAQKCKWAKRCNSTWEGIEKLCA